MNPAGGPLTAPTAQQYNRGRLQFKKQLQHPLQTLMTTWNCDSCEPPSMRLLGVSDSREGGGVAEQESLKNLLVLNFRVALPL